MKFFLVTPFSCRLNITFFFATGYILLSCEFLVYFGVEFKNFGVTFQLKIEIYIPFSPCIYLIVFWFILVWCFLIFPVWFLKHVFSF